MISDKIVKKCYCIVTFS